MTAPMPGAAPADLFTPMRGADATIVTRIRAARAAGRIPVVGDVRWPDAVWRAARGPLKGPDARALLAAAGVRPGLAGPDLPWATLTSGTTGTPATIVRSAASWRASYRVTERLVGLAADDVIGIRAPLSSSLTLFALGHADDRGLPFVPGAGMPARAFADRVTIAHVTPSQLARLLDGLADARGVVRPGRLRAALVGAAHLPDRLRLRAERAGLLVVAYYGAAELSYVAVARPDGLHPIPEVRTRVDADGTLWVASDLVAAGRLDPPDRPGPLRRDGDWHTVGDQVRRTPSGALELLGREDGAITTAGVTVPPAPVERLVETVPGVATAVVVGVPAPVVGALIGCAVEPEDATADPAALVAACRRTLASRLPATHVPRRWRVLAPLPLTASGKPDRRAILAALGAAAGQAVPQGAGKARAR